MTLLLDGYNILKKIKHTSYITDTERQKFIKQLNNYAHQKKLILVLVFDGGPHTWSSTEKVSNYISVTYSGAKETADDYIKRYIDEHKGIDILLVSSDRELVTYAHRQSIPSLDSYEFSQFLYTMESPTQQSTPKSKQQAHKLTETAHRELDILMEKFKVNSIKIDNDIDQKREPSQKLSKNERKLLQKIKKL